MNDKRIIVKIDRCGRPEITTEGFIGEACLKASAPIERALTDGKGVDQSFSPEYYQQNTDVVEQQQMW